jgi:orotate phosphoribosyltransferase
MGLFVPRSFVGHAGGELSFKIECDALDEEDYSALAQIISRKITFSRVIGVPSGGLPLARALTKYCSESGPLLIVDDVLTTGTSMEEARQQAGDHYKSVVGVVIFSRGVCPNWIKPIFQLSKWAQ